jgi:hypothetical protein
VALEAAGAEVGADADGGSGNWRERKRISQPSGRRDDWRGLFPGMACYGSLCSQQGGRPKCQIQPGVHLPEGAGYGDVGVDARALVPVVTTRKSLAVVKRLARRHRLV